MDSKTSALDKEKMTANFNAAASSYESVSALQRYVGKELFERLQMIKTTPLMLMDLGSGPGCLSQGLMHQFPKSRIIQLDIAERMLHIARSKHKRRDSWQHYICADAEKLPFASGSVDMAFSNLMLQWCHQPDQLLQELIRTLKPDGLFVFSSFGPDTLFELRESWASVDVQPHVHTFLDMHDLGDALTRAGFIEPVLEVDYVTLTYDTVKALMRDLKLLGADNVSESRRKSLTGKNRFLQMQQAYETRRKNGKLPATYEVIYAHAWLPPSERGLKQGVAGTFEISIDSIRQALKRLRN